MAGWRATSLTARLGIALPILQAPMAGGPTTPALVAAVSAAGGLGILATGYQDAATIRDAVRQVRALTDRPFGANVLVTPPATATAEEMANARAFLAPRWAALGLAPPDVPASSPADHDAALAVLAEERVPLLTFAFGLPDDVGLGAARRAGLMLAGTATTVAEARDLAARGMDVVIAQGAEAGGHRGTYLGDFEAALVGTMALVPQVVDAVDVPVVAAGGIMDGRGIAAALALGAAGVQLGTAFLRCPEAGTHAAHRAALAASTDEATVVTAAFSGKPVRALANAYFRDARAVPGPLPPYPIMHALTRDLRRAAARAGRPDLMGMWAGQGAPLAREAGAAALVGRWAAEVDAVLARLGGE